MTEFVRKPSRITALQFGASGGNAQEIAQSLIPLGVTTIWTPEHSQFGLNEVNEIEESKVPEVLRLLDNAHNTEWTVSPGSWVTVNQLGELVVYTDAEFAMLYQTA